MLPGSEGQYTCGAECRQTEQTEPIGRKTSRVGIFSTPNTNPALTYPQRLPIVGRPSGPSPLPGPPGKPVVIEAQPPDYLRSWLLLNLVVTTSPARRRDLLKACGSVENAVAATDS